MFSFPTLKPTLRFSDVEVVAIPAVCLANGLRLLGTSKVKLFEMHCFKMFITALCVIFLSNFDDQRTKVSQDDSFMLKHDLTHKGNLTYVGFSFHRGGGERRNGHGNKFGI